ncbi:MAG: hypothetical protein WCP06_06060 [Verrucomicrobiota bacterium]
MGVAQGWYGVAPSALKKESTKFDAFALKNTALPVDVREKDTMVHRENAKMFKKPAVILSLLM